MTKFAQQLEKLLLHLIKVAAVPQKLWVFMD